MMEPSVYGCNMSVPYGSWMGNTIKDAFWPSARPFRLLIPSVHA